MSGWIAGSGSGSRTLVDDSDALYASHVNQLREAADAFATAIVARSANAPYYATGTADQTVINAAITAVNAAGGGVVQLGPGTYNVSGTINMKSNVVLRGCGPYATIIKTAANPNFHTFTISNVQNAAFVDFQIDGNKGASTVAGVHLMRIDTNCQNLLFENLYLHDSVQHGIISSYATGPHTNITIRNVRAENMGLASVGSGSGFYMLYCLNLKMSDVTATGCQLDGIQWGDIPGPADRIELSNIVVYNNIRYGLYIPSGHCNVSNITAYGNEIGIMVEQNATMNLSNAEIYTNNFDGVRISASDGSTLTNVRSYNNGQTSTGAGLRLSAPGASDTCNHHVITNSIFFDNQGSPTQEYGIWGSGSGSVDSNLVSDSQCYGNSSQQFRTDTWGTANVVDNVVGFNPRGMANYSLSSTKQFNRDTGELQVATLNNSISWSLASGRQRGDVISIQFIQDATGGRVATPTGTNIAFAGGAFNQTTTANAADIYRFRWNSSKWIEESRSLNVS